MIFELHHGDCLDIMPTLPENSVDAIVTDPPYGLSFMGKDWDHGVPGEHFWQEALRVLKPGGHLLAFGGSRTYHWLAVNIERAGFEVRDQIMWLYGSGFPKSLDVSKAIDKAAGAEREVVGRRTDGRYASGFSEAAKKALGTMVAADSASGFSGEMGVITAPATDAARQWQGWGTALKPAHEPICVARKPLIGTVAENVLTHGTGAFNIDGCRVELQGAEDAAVFENNHRVTERLPVDRGGQPLGLHDGGWKQRVGDAVIPPGRWPANLIHDGSDEVLRAFPEVKGQKGATSGRSKGSVCGDVTAGRTGVAPRVEIEASAARFFYCAKATKKDRGADNRHPTVKPTDLMAYLCRLVTPPGGVVLDPFTGSGSTGKAAIREGFRFIGIEREAEYVAIAQARISAATIEGLL